jgi:dUTP pyrophosphatase
LNVKINKMEGFEKELNGLNELKSLMEQIESFNQSEINGFNDENWGNFKIKTKFTNSSNNPDPEYAKVGDSGFDLRAFISEPITLKPLERKLIPTGLKFELTPNTELQVRPRSGMALKYGISVLNTPGTVDEGYRGDVGVIVVNLSNEVYIIQPGERIAQGVIMNVVGQSISELVKTNNLSETERGSNGFGSTGNN